MKGRITTPPTTPGEKEQGKAKRKGNVRVKPDKAYTIALKCVYNIVMCTMYCSQTNTQSIAM
jgi:hypothetical protein